MICLVIGGAKSGKSMYAQNLAKELNNNSSNMYYIATMNPYDEEDYNRIDRHLKEREGYGFKTIEIQRNLSKLTYKIDKKSTLLIDSITSIVTNEMFVGKDFNKEVHEKINYSLKEISINSLNTIMVSDYISSDSINYDYYTENFRKEMGIINRDISKYCDVVIECVFNNIIIHKGNKLMQNIKYI